MNVDNNTGTPLLQQTLTFDNHTLLLTIHFVDGHKETCDDVASLVSTEASKIPDTEEAISLIDEAEVEVEINGECEVEYEEEREPEVPLEVTAEASEDEKEEETVVDVVYEAEETPSIEANVVDRESSGTALRSRNISDVDDAVNPLLIGEVPEFDTNVDDENISLVSSEEVLQTVGELSSLHPDDPRTILTWKSSGLGNDAGRRKIFDRFLQLVETTKPDIVVIQNVQLCESEMTGLAPRLHRNGYNRGSNISHEQKMKDAKLIEELSRNPFKHYYSVKSLASWKNGGQLIYIKKRFEYITVRYSLNMRISPKYHQQEGRTIMLQFKSYYLLCLMSPMDGWVVSDVKTRMKWDSEVGRMIHEFKDTKAVIICGNLNCAPQDIDLSDPERLKRETSPVLHETENIGYPGSRQSDRDGLRWLMSAGRLKDVFRVKHPYNGNDSQKDNLQYTSLAYLGDKTRCAVRTNLTLMSSYFLGNVSRCDIVGKTSDLTPSGWRHLPQMLVMKVKH